MNWINLFLAVNPLLAFYSRVNTITGWYAASIEVAQDFRRFVHAHAKFNILSGQAGPPVQITAQDIEAICNLLPSHIPPPRRQDLLSRVKSASVHAEAALMLHVISTRKPTGEYEYPFGVGRKCCSSCWEFREECESEAPGTGLNTRSSHYSFYAWVSPLNTPESMLRQRRKALIEVILGRTVRSTSQLSSGPELPGTISSSSSPYEFI